MWSFSGIDVYVTCHISDPKAIFTCESVPYRRTFLSLTPIDQKIIYSLGLLKCRGGYPGATIFSISMAVFFAMEARLLRPQPADVLPKMFK